MFSNLHHCFSNSVKGIRIKCFKHHIRRFYNYINHLPQVTDNKMYRVHPVTERYNSHFSSDGTVCIGKCISKYHSLADPKSQIILIIRVIKLRGRRGRDRMVVEFTTTYAISAYHH